MTVKIMDKPAILIEAVELLSLYVNHGTFDNIKRDYKLTHESYWNGEGREFFRAYFAALDEMIHEGLTGVDLSDDGMQYFFRDLKGADGKPWICLANIMVYSFFDAFSGCLRDDCGDFQAELTACLEQYREFARDYFSHYEVLEVTNLGISYLPVSAGKAPALSKQIGQLELPSSCKWEIFDMLVNYETLLEKLARLIEPVVRKLEVLLCRHEKIFQDVTAYWANYFASHSFPEFKKSVLGIDVEASGTDAQQVLWPWWLGLGRYRYNMDESGESMMLGFGVRMERISKAAGYVKDRLANVLRFLGDPIKLDILYKLSERSYYGLELANELGLTSGTMSKYLNTLFNIGLINLHRENGRIYYRTDEDAVRRMIHQLQLSLLGEVN
ncbi:MAG: ArsR/SmtB family transcription factor [Faecousia sp.]